MRSLRAVPHLIDAIRRQWDEGLSLERLTIGRPVELDLARNGHMSEDGEMILLGPLSAALHDIGAEAFERVQAQARGEKDARVAEILNAILESWEGKGPPVFTGVHLRYVNPAARPPGSTRPPPPSGP